ncbi:glycosyltransferase [Escherichia coli]|uniref:glycosyltransferase n=1 Tax=Escherichia coli TaxID=562 RepID=UPI000BE13CCB|nr:glycosyltransferase [Escherichia coli]
MKISALLYLYNKEDKCYLYDCLDSIRLNTRTPEQVVIVYDGPIGEELNSVVTYFSNLLPIEIVRIPHNVGLGQALNRGLEFCRNEIVFRMDTDDKCDRLRFEKQLDMLKIHPDIVLMGGAVEEFDETMTKSLGVRYTVESHEQIKSYVRKRNPFNHMTIMFKKSIIQSLGGYEHHHLMEDYNLWLRVIAAGYKSYNIPQVLVYVRAGRGMLGRRRGILYVFSEIKLAKLKYKLKTDNIYGVVKYSFIRILPRLLPVFILRHLYAMLRK